MHVTVESLVRENADPDAATRRIALLGLRGAGKSTLGARLAAALGVPFVELDHEVEREAGAELGEVFAMYGQEAFRRFERRALERVLRTHEKAVIAASGTSMKREASSISLMISRPARCAATSCGRSIGTPGDNTIRSLARKVASSCRSSSRMMVYPASSANGPARAASLRMSVTVTRAPFDARKRAQATPVLASPTTRMFLLL